MSDDFWDGPNWAIIGPLSEDIANEDREIEKARKDAFGENYLEPEDPDTDMNGENNDTDFDFDPETDQSIE